MNEQHAPGPTDGATPARATVGAPVTQLFRPRWLAPVEPAAVLAGHAVAVDADGRIAEVGPAAELAARHPQATCVDLPDHLLVPGFVNLHAHAAMSLLRGAGDDLPLERWLRERIWPMESALVSDAFVHDGTALACHEMVTGGVTTFHDHYFFPEAAIRAAQGFDMRITASVVLIDFPTPWASGPDEALRKGLALRDALRDEPRVRFALGPHAPYTVGDAVFRECATVAAELGLGIHVHVHETATEVAQSLAEHGERPLARLARLGVLGPDTICVHAVHLDDADIARLAEHGASVAHCPHSNLKLASGIAPAARLARAGIPVGIGTDGSASNNRLDLMAEARTASLLAKGASGDATAWDAQATLRAMTLDGARAMGMADDIGSIRAGKQADLVAVDFADPRLVPVTDPVSHLVYLCGREHVSDVWIGGQPVVRARQLHQPHARRLLMEVMARSSIWQNRREESLQSGEP